MGNSDHNDKRNGNWTPIAIAAVSALVGSGGGVALVFNTDLGQNMARPDPFTGSDGAALEQRVEHVEQELYDHTHNHPDVTNEFDRRITRLETQISIMIQNQERILSRLDKL